MNNINKLTNKTNKTFIFGLMISFFACNTMDKKRGYDKNDLVLTSNKSIKSLNALINIFDPKSKIKQLNTKNYNSHNLLGDLINKIENTDEKEYSQETKTNKLYKIHQLSNNLYYFKSYDKENLYFVFEKINAKNIKFWNKYAVSQKNLIDDKKNGGIIGFQNNLYQWNKNKKDDLWICYAVIKKPSDIASTEVGNHENSYIEMAMGVFTNNQSIISTHMGIHRTNEFEKNSSMRKSRHERISSLLHKAASKFTPKLYPKVKYMVTCPLQIMRNIMFNNFFNKNEPILWIGDQIQNNKFNEWNDQVLNLRKELTELSTKNDKTMGSRVKKSNEINKHFDDLVKNIKLKKTKNIEEILKKLDTYYGLNTQDKRFNNINIKFKYLYMKKCIKNNDKNDCFIEYINYFRNLLIIYTIRDGILRKTLKKYLLSDINKIDTNDKQNYVYNTCELFHTQKQRMKTFTNSKIKCPLSINFSNKSILDCSKNINNKTYSMPGYFFEHPDIYQKCYDRPLTILDIKKLNQ